MGHKNSPGPDVGMDRYALNFVAQVEGVEPGDVKVFSDGAPKSVWGTPAWPDTPTHSPCAAKADKVPYDL